LSPEATPEVEATSADGAASPAKRPIGSALFVLLASAAFATSGPLARSARPVEPLVIALGRVALAGALLAALDLPGLLSAVRALPRARRLQVAGAGVLLAAHFALFLVGLDRTSLAAAVSLVSLEPLAVVLTAWAIHGIRPSRLELLGVALATVGAVVVSSGAGTGDHRLSGDLLVIGAVVLYGFYVSAARSLGDHLPARPYAALVYLAAALTLVVVLPIAGIGAAALALPPHGAAAIIALALIPTVLGHTMVQTAARRLSPSVVALVSPGETLGSLAIGAALLGAVPSAPELAGAMIVLSGCVLAIRGARRAR
jgi:drug/metabolite transporter (DMT)-like permease